MPSSKSRTTPASSWTFDAIGTSWQIDTFDVPATSNTKQAVADRIESFDQIYSRFRNDSLITRIATTAGRYELPPDAGPLLSWYRQLYELTDGAVTPLIGQTLSDAGYDAAYSLVPKQPKPAVPWDIVMHVDNDSLTVSQPTLLDFGAAGKGYLIDLLGALLERHGIHSYCIDGSGDILCRSLIEPLRIGLEHPSDASQVIGVYELQDGALCGSASNRRSWGDYNHVIDARSARPMHTISATWAAADTAMVADGLATALFFTEAAQLSSVSAFGFARIDQHNNVERSANFNAELFIS